MPKNNLLYLLLYNLITLYSYQANCQIAKSGQYPTRIFGPSDYHADRAILSVIEDNEGKLLIANTDGVLVFNGTRWKLIELNRNSRALWLTKDTSGTIYVGGEDELGYLEIENNQYSYKSLIPLLPDTLHGFGSIWEVEHATDGTYFRSSRYLFRYHKGIMHILSHEDFPGGTFDVLQSVNDTIYIRKRDLGIGRVMENSFNLIPFGEYFKDIKLNGILPIGNDKIVLTRNEGILRITKTGVEKFASEIHEELREAKIYHASIKNAMIAVATLTNGVYLLDLNGKKVAHINEADYNINESANYTYFDKQGALWVGTLNGVARVEIQDGIRIHPSINKKDHAVFDLMQFNGKLYVGTHAGLFKVTNTDFQNAEAVKGYNSRVTTIKLLEGILSATGYAGTCLIDSTGKEVRITGIMEIHKLKGTAEYLGSGQEGIQLLRKTGKFAFEKLKKLPVPNNITAIIEFEPNKLWAASSSGGLTYYDLTTDSIRVYPKLVNTKLSTVDKNVYFVTSQGVLEFKDSTFTRSNFIYTYIDSIQFNVQHLDSDTNGNTMILYNDLQGRTLGLYLKKSSDGYTRQYLPDFGLRNTDLIATLLEDNGTLWIATHSRIIEVNLNSKLASSNPFEVQITSILANDTLILSNTEKRALIPFKNNKLVFEFGSFQLSSLGENSYQYRLIGLNEEWSNWSNERTVSYPYLPPGTYRFEVRGINPYQVYSDVSSFSFTILQPWYANNWSYTLYFIMLTTLVIVIVRLRSNKLKREKKRLQEIIAASTLEIAAKNEKLQEMDKIKNRFYSNISHEFRTPLTLIIGPLEDYMESDEKPTKQAYQSLLKNARRLLDLINQLLDLTKLEAKQMPLVLTHQKLISTLTNVHESFTGLAKHNEIDFQLNLDISREDVLFDADKMDKILYNLLSNAFKFTSAGGKIVLGASDSENTYQITVTDTGAGISKENLAFIFERFYQGPEAQRATLPGTGIGLALVKELVELHGGNIEVSSVPNQGSTFTVLLPRNPLIKKKILHNIIEDEQ